jgi:toxin ParE1/3/4
MKRLRLTPRALSDLDAIADYTLAQWGDKQAEKYLLEIERRFRWLVRNPNAGRVREDISKGYRSYVQGGHVIFYVIEDDAVIVIGVPHGAMDIEAYFDKP